MNRTVLAIIKADTREFVSIEVHDNAEDLDRAWREMKPGYTAEPFRLTEPARRFLLADYVSIACPSCDAVIRIDADTLGDLIAAASAHVCEGDEDGE